MFKKLIDKLFGKKAAPAAPEKKPADQSRTGKKESQRETGSGQEPRHKQSQSRSEKQPRQEQKQERKQERPQQERKQDRPQQEKKQGGKQEPRPGKEQNAQQGGSKQGPRQERGRQQNPQQEQGGENRPKKERRPERAFALTAENHSHPHLKAGCKVHIRQILHEGTVVRGRGESLDGKPVNVTGSIGYFRNFGITGVPRNLRKFYKNNSLFELEEEAELKARDLNEKAPNTPLDDLKDTLDAVLDAGGGQEEETEETAEAPVLSAEEALWADEIAQDGAGGDTETRED